MEKEEIKFRRAAAATISAACRLLQKQARLDIIGLMKARGVYKLRIPKNLLSVPFRGYDGETVLQPVYGFVLDAGRNLLFAALNCEHCAQAVEDMFAQAGLSGEERETLLCEDEAFVELDASEEGTAAMPFLPDCLNAVSDALRKIPYAVGERVFWNDPDRSLPDQLDGEELKEYRNSVWYVDECQDPDGGAVITPSPGDPVTVEVLTSELEPAIASK